ncbi:hypothetical protein [uncultured Paraglaciecola sp.]|uniref:hypothetical protein n=1 Tax=uncultured Paraglaciecola sp. TaxID=1765024 RepID=UPI0030D7977E|tara:strand:+ start:9136 stop:10074 length:939 start_codon:yes stop_codon:yes gene_type:complete
MSLDNPNGIESSVSKSTKLRRKFLKRASATAVVGAIPAKSVWATGVANSIVASGHGSDFAYGRDLELLGPCEILTVLSANTDAGLDLNFETVFGVGSGPNQTFSEILSCHCGCPSSATIRYGISNVVFLVKNSDGTYQRIKVDEYGTHGDIKDPNDPTRYYAYILDTYAPDGTIEDYVIKAGQMYYNQAGQEVSIGNPSWYTGFNGPNIDESFNANQSISGSSSNFSSANSCEGDDTTTYMIAIYLNARFDLYFRGGQPATDSWNGSHGIYYPILNSTNNVGNLVASIEASKDQLYDILSDNGADLTPPTCL